MHWGDKLKRLRKERGVRQEEIAAVLGVSRPLISLIEKGKRKLHDYEAQQLQNFFGVPPGFFETQSKQLPENMLRILEKLQAVYDQPDFFDFERFKECLLIILCEVGARPNVGETVLYKLLYYIDSDWLEIHGCTFFGANYIANNYGPTPIEFRDVVEIMEQNQEIVRVEKSYFRYNQVKYLPVRNPDDSIFSDQEMEHIYMKIDSLANMSARQISNYSHLDPPWLNQERGGLICMKDVLSRPEHHSAYTRNGERIMPN